MHDRVIDILESFPTWIDLYEITGRIQLPNVDLEVDGLDQENMAKLIKAFEQSAELQRPRGKRFTTPVDLPRLDVSSF